MNNGKFKIKLEEYIGTDEEAVVPAGVTGIGEWAFYCCEHVTRAVIPEGVTSIGDEAFSGCRNLVSVTLPTSLTSIGKEVSTMTLLSWVAP